MTLKLFVLLFCVSVCMSAQHHWTYNEQTDPNDWTGVCTEGKNQSPIEITPNETTQIKMEPFTFQFYNNQPVAESLTNNGHSITFTLKAQREIIYPKITGGGLPGVFQFEQFHFHWGLLDERGSEHNIYGLRHPMELHLVHFNSLYGSNMSEALNNSNNAYDTLAVLSVFFDIHPDDNPVLEPITDMLEFLTYQNDVINNVTLFHLENLLPKNRHDFYRYNGSLTTPPCSEVVIWSIFKDPIKISEAQMEKFRTVGNLPRSNTTTNDSSFESESDNFRMIQYLNGRSVFSVNTNYVVNKEKDNHDQPPASSAHTIIISAAYLLISLIVLNSMTNFA